MGADIRAVLLPCNPTPCAYRPYHRQVPAPPPAHAVPTLHPRTRCHGGVVEGIVPVPGGHATVVVLQHPVQALRYSGRYTARYSEVQREVRWGGSHRRHAGPKCGRWGNSRRRCVAAAVRPRGAAAGACCCYRPIANTDILTTTHKPIPCRLRPTPRRTWMYASTTARRPASPATCSFSR